MNTGIEPNPTKATKLNNFAGAQSYVLVSNFIRYGRQKFKLSANANYVMITLLNFYNPTKKYVFPKHETISEQTGLSISTIKRCISELVDAHLLLKSRRKNCNIYAFTSAIFELSDSSQRTTKIVHSELSHDKKQNKENKITQQHVTPAEPKPKKNVVAFAKNSLKAVPESILNKKYDRTGKPIRNHTAYWNSLTDEQKRQYLQAEQDLKTKKEASKKRQEQEQKQKIEQEQQLRNELSKPLNEQWTRNQAICHVWRTRVFHHGKLKEGFTKTLAELYNLDVMAICQMSAEEIEKIS